MEPLRIRSGNKTVGAICIMLISILSLVNTPATVFAQEKRGGITRKEMRKIIKAQKADKPENYECAIRNKFNPSQRMNLYPFNKASEVLLVSFDNKIDSLGNFPWLGNQLPMRNGEVDVRKLDEIKTLNKKEIDSLTFILYNIVYKGEIFELTGSGCYNPRNAILFKDSTANIFEFIELCFECHDFRLSTEKIETGDFCTSKFEYLKGFFKQVGIEIGITRGFKLRTNSDK